MPRKKYSVFISALLAFVLVCGQLVGCGAQPAGGSGGDQGSAATTDAKAAEPSETGTTYASAWKPRDGYTLKRVVAMSRHNLRAPQDKDMETLGKVTTHEWIKWSANGSELTNKGGVAETIMGEFFRKWLENERLVPQNYIPGENEVRFYANPVSALSQPHSTSRRACFP